MPFRDVAGHRRILELLSRAIAGGSLPPSIIFSGPEGVGKRRVAVVVAQALNCTSRGGVATGPAEAASPAEPMGPAEAGHYVDVADACGACAACRRIARGVHSDVVTVVPGETGSIKIEQIREVIDRTMYRPFEGRKRVTIIDDADALMMPAQNALLKTLEEPPSTSVFILVTAHPDMLLDTVRSRCSQIRFGRLNAADVALVLERDHQYSQRDALAAAAASDGSVGMALQANGEDTADARGDAEALLRSARTRSDARARVERAGTLVKGGGPASSEREHLGLRLQALSSLARDLGVLASGASPHLLANVDLRDELNALSGSFDSQRALGLFAAVDRAQDALDRNVSPKVVADWLALQV
jgi:DNA polymerase III subunit delta'